MPAAQITLTYLSRRIQSTWVKNGCYEIWMVLGSVNWLREVILSRKGEDTSQSRSVGSKILILIYLHKLIHCSPWSIIHKPLPHSPVQRCTPINFCNIPFASKCPRPRSKDSSSTFMAASVSAISRDPIPRSEESLTVAEEVFTRKCRINKWLACCY